MTVTVEEILDRAVLEGYLTPVVAAEGPAHSAGFLRFGPLDGVSSPSGWSVLHGSGVAGPPAGALAVDLGTGGGIPGLVLATLTMCRWVLVDRGERRGSFLRWAVRRLCLGDRVEVVVADAVEVGRGPLRGKANLVTARGFAPPGPTAECGAPLLLPGGLLVVSEPPDTTRGQAGRWEDGGLRTLGLEDRGGWYTGLAGYRAMELVADCPDRFPRRFNRQTADPLIQG